LQIWGALLRVLFCAQHSVLVSKYCSLENKRWGLIHDAAEAYLGDMCRPIKQGFPVFKEIEDEILKEIAQYCGLLWPIPEEVKEIDNRLLRTEARDLMKSKASSWDIYNIQPYDEIIIPKKDMNKVEELFLREYSTLEKIHRRVLD